VDVNRNRVREKDGKVFWMESVEIARTDYLKHDYRFEPRQCPIQLKANGHFPLFEFKSERPGTPRFEGRWDEDARALDLDIPDCTAAQRKEFRRRSGRYKGHSTVLTGKDVWEFEVELAIPKEEVPGVDDGKIFLGRDPAFGATARVRTSGDGNNFSVRGGESYSSRREQDTARLEVVNELFDSISSLAVCSCAGARGVGAERGSDGAVGDSCVTESNLYAVEHHRYQPAERVGGSYNRGVLDFASSGEAGF
jgi:hypothetical protein